MQRFFLIAAALLLMLMSPTVVNAENQPSSMLSSGQLSLIRQNCVAAQALITRLHTNDAGARVYLGQEYETILAKLMTPMNSRVVVNKYDGSSLIKTAAEFSTKLDSFRSTYQKYDEQIKRILQMKCTDQPVSFLDALTAARDYRKSARDIVADLGGLVQQYRAQVDELKAQISSDQSQSGDQ